MWIGVLSWYKSMKKNAIIILFIIFLPFNVHAISYGTDYLFDAYHRVALKYAVNEQTILKTLRKLSTPMKVSVAGEANAIKTAAEVVVTSSEGVGLKRTIMSTIGRVTGSGMLGIVALGGITFGLAGDYIDWLIGQGAIDHPELNLHKKTADNYIYKTEYTSSGDINPISHPIACHGSMSQQGSCAYVGNFANASAAQAAVANQAPTTALAACGAGSVCSYTGCWSYNWWSETINGITSQGYRAAIICTKGGVWVGDSKFSTYPTGFTVPIETKLNEVEISGLASSGYAHDVEKWRDNVAATVVAVNEAIADENAKIRNAPGLSFPDLIKKVADSLDPTESAAQDQDVLNPATTDLMKPDDILTDDEAAIERDKANKLWESANVVNEQIASSTAAIAAAVNAMANVIDNGASDPVPVDPTVVMPTKLSLTNIMTSFVNSIKALPMFATLNGLSINCTGATSNLCMALPAKLGGTTCFDASKMQGSLNTVGSAFLGLTALFSFIYVFRG